MKVRVAHVCVQSGARDARDGVSGGARRAPATGGLPPGERVARAQVPRAARRARLAGQLRTPARDALLHVAPLSRLALTRPRASPPPRAHSRFELLKRRSLITLCYLSPIICTCVCKY